MYCSILTHNRKRNLEIYPYKNQQTLISKDSRNIAKSTIDFSTSNDEFREEYFR